MSIYRKFCKEEFDIDGVLAHFELHYPENFNFGYDVIDQIAVDEPDKTALVWCNTEGEERFFTFRDISVLSNKAANVFQRAGISKGDKVMAVLKHHYEYWYTAIALHKLGAILIPVTHMLTAKDLVYRVNNAKIKGVVCTPEDQVPQRLLSAKKNCDSLRVLWTVRKTIPGFINLTEAVEQAPCYIDREKTSAHEPILLYFTSGTTGYPKGVVHDHTYPLAHIITAKYWQQVIDGGLHFTVAETGWAKTSWGKIYGQWLVGSAVMAYDFDSFDPKQLMTVINRYHVTTFCAPPTIYRYLVRKGIIDMPSLKHVSTAGEALSPEVFGRFTELTGLELMEGYGQTESTLILANLAGSAYRPGSMGKPTPLYHVELLKDDGVLAKEGEIGEIVIIPPKEENQPGIFVGYHDNDVLYQNVWRDGVYHTGDTAKKDTDGYFWFNGRADDIIKSGGFRIGPSEIEHVLLEHPAVMECSVIGVPDQLRGQAIKAVVVLAPGYSASLELQKDIREYCNSRVSEYKWVRFIEFVREMPKTISGKICKVDLRLNML